MSAILQERPETGCNTGTALDAVAERGRMKAIARRGLRRLIYPERRGEHQGLYECGQPLPGEHPSKLDTSPDGQVSIGGVIRCKNKHVCPMCAGAERIKDTATVAWRANEHLKAGRGLSLLTLAPRHARGERLDAQLACLNESFQATMRSKKVQAVLEHYGVVGGCKVVEATFGTNGAHPHIHALVFHREFIDIEENEEQQLKSVIWETFNKQLKSWATKSAKKSKRYVTPYGGKRRKETNAEFYELPDSWRKDASWAHGIDFTPIKPDNAGGSKIAAYCNKIQLELTRSDLKVGRQSTSRSLMQVMFDYGDNPNPQDAAILHEFIPATKGSHLVSWFGTFRGKNPLYGEAPEEFYQKALDEYAEANGLSTDRERTTVAGIEPSLHRQIDLKDASTGNPLIWELKRTYQTTRDLNDVVILLNRNLPNPVYLNHDTEHPYPIITRQIELEPVPTLDERNAEHKEALAYMRDLAYKRRTAYVHNWVAKHLEHKEFIKQLEEHQLTERRNQ